MRPTWPGLTLDEQEGIEYWMAMNLAGDYASACHHVIHEKIATQLGREPMTRVENHHNFAWKEIHEGRELIVHQKGRHAGRQRCTGNDPRFDDCSRFYRQRQR